ncbi:Tctex1 domain containing 1 [Phyllostomus discolor]|uniref:Tctex1 domain containing 1 n=1 Tax=Phyllostomus discolor TaxID=89673 RepID=A0A834AIT5_9CHIR|nr:Tctex1 domain containing 1 [Phyllostomus discolor]
MSDIAKDRTGHSLKNRGSASSLSRKELHGRIKGSLSAVSYVDEPSQRDVASRLTVQMENTYQLVQQRTVESLCSRPWAHVLYSDRKTMRLVFPGGAGPSKHFPVAIVNHILKDVLTNSLQEEQYEPELCRHMTKMISEVIKAQVKALLVPRYKLIVMVYIGQLSGQSILVGSRCLWNPKSDNFASYVFRNSSLFALATVYAVYFE